MFEREKEQPQDQASATSAFLGQGTRVTGKLTLSGPGRIEGQFEGEIAAEDALVIGEHAVVNAKIHGTTIVVHGHVTGDITARTRVELRAPSKVFGNISAPSLVIHEGVLFDGRCTMGGDAAATASTTPRDVSALLEKKPATPPARAQMGAPPA
jgi:cytoskeletal protein CcmA (bactofilin family)